VELPPLEGARQAHDGYVAEVDDAGARKVDDARALLAQLRFRGVELRTHFAVAGHRDHRQAALRTAPSSVSCSSGCRPGRRGDEHFRAPAFSSATSLRIQATLSSSASLSPASAPILSWPVAARSFSRAPGASNGAAHATSVRSGDICSDSVGAGAPRQAGHLLATRYQRE